MKGRRGISPLIATILLIAFAVALGSLVYSYIVIFQGGTGTRGCSNIVSIDSTLKTDGQAAYQISNAEIVIDVRNTGYADVSSVAIAYVGSEENEEIGPEPARLNVGRTDKFRHPYNRDTLGTLQTIIVTPYFIQAEEEVICNEASIEIRQQLR